MILVARYLSDEAGIETLEWIVLVVAFALYPGVLQTSLNTIVSNVGSALTTQSSG